MTGTTPKPTRPAHDTAGLPIKAELSYFILLDGACYGLVSGEQVFDLIRRGSHASFELAR